MVDADMFAWFQAQGADWQARMRRRWPAQQRTGLSKKSVFSSERSDWIWLSRSASHLCAQASFPTCRACWPTHSTRATRAAVLYR